MGEALGGAGGAGGGGGAGAGDAGGRPPRVKMVLLGDSGVGKSCLVLRFVRGEFDPSSKVTVGAAFMSHPVSLPDSSTVKFEIWDTAGQERYASLAPLYYRGAHAAAVVFDITSEDSYERAKYWIKELQAKASGEIVIALVGNKADLAAEREVSTETAEDFARSGNMAFIETSAKTADNVSELFETIAQKLSASSLAGTTGQGGAPP